MQMPSSNPPQIVLASTSPYRKVLLSTLTSSFVCTSPSADETAQPDEAADALAQRLARAKAESLINHHPYSLIIGSDQVASLNGHCLGKPGNYDNAFTQLSMSSGQIVSFFTGICLLNSQSGKYQLDVVQFDVRFRQLTKEQIHHYLLREQPYDCAGSFKSEGLGIALFEEMRGSDPSSLIGLPLIRLTHMLMNEGIDILTLE
ncbi:Maf family protein [Pokkaliibacter plantistimulans]|nr:Maf family nucleotide pyrophosphatase [Pokkaliibacter plantistimulans]